MLGPDHSETLLSAALLARLLHDQRRIDAAMPLHAEFLVGWSRLFGDDHAWAQDVARKMTGNLPSLEHLGPHEEAIRSLSAWHERMLPPDSPTITTDRIYLALIDLDEKEQAQELLRVASELCADRNESPPAHWTYAAALADLLSPEDAEDLLYQAWEELLAFPDGKRRPVARWLAALNEHWDRPDEALFWRDEAE